MKVSLKNATLHFLQGIDYSFSFIASSASAIDDFFVNYDGTTATSTTIYLGSSGDTISTKSANTRIVSDYIQVMPGMIINCDYWGNTATTPSVICFDANKNLLNTIGAWSEQSGNKMIVNNYTIPQGVAFIKLQMQPSGVTANATKATGTMPSDN